MSTPARLISLAVVLMLLWVDVSFAEVTPITGVEAGVDGHPPYALQSITVGDFTITKEFLATGSSVGRAILGTHIRFADDFDLNTVATRSNSGYWRVVKIGGADTYRDTNGDAPDFFVFEAGSNDPLCVQAVLADGTLGKVVMIPQNTWGDTGLDRVGLLNMNQPIGGIAFAITDLLDSEGQSLAPNAAIQGLQFCTEDLDPVHFSAAMMVPEPATLVVLGLGGLFIMRRRP